MLRGENIFLRLMEERDIPYKVSWLEDPEVRRTLNFEYPISQVATKHWLNRVCQDRTRKDFIVCLKEQELPIGFCGLLGMDYRYSKAETYLAIGDKSHWGKGYGKELNDILFRYGFLELGLNKIYSYVWVKNEKVVHIYKEFGFKIEGTLREDIFSHGEYRDRHVMGLLRKDYILSRSGE